jgi:hypothetical protein
VVVIAGGAGLLTVIVSVPLVDDTPPAALESFMVTVNVTDPFAVGVPLMAPVLEFIESPSLVDGVKLQLQVSAPEPPAAVSAKLYACPAVAGAVVNWACVVDTLGAALTVTVTLFAIVGWSIDVAVIVAVPVALDPLNCTEVIVTFVSAPFAGQAAPAQAHVTPLPASFLGTTVIVMLCPWSIARTVPPGKVSVIPPPLLQLPRRTTDATTKHTDTQVTQRFMSISLRARPGPSLIANGHSVDGAAQFLFLEQLNIK